MPELQAVDDSTISAWSTAAGAIATFIAVVVALFGTSIDRRIRGPRLKLLQDLPQELGTQSKAVAGSLDAHTNVVWLRLPIFNYGRSTAEDVRILFARLEAPDMPQLQPPSRELKWADVPVDTIAIPAKVTRLVDIAHVVRTVDKKGKRRVGLVIGVVPLGKTDSGEPDTRLWNEVKTGVHRVHVIISGAAVRASSATIEFNLNRDADEAEDIQLLNNALVSRQTF